MKQKVVLLIDEGKSVYDADNNYIGILSTEPVPVPVEKKSVDVAELIKLGVTVDEVIKLRNNELI